MNQDLVTLVRSKDLPKDEMYEVFTILRGDNITEDLIDYISRLVHEGIEENEDEIEGLKRTIKDLEKDLEMVRDERDELKEDAVVEELKAERLSSFLEEFEDKHDRHPAIEEVWEASWNGCREVMKREDKKERT